jgi:hypothetical protein
VIDRTAQHAAQLGRAHLGVDGVEAGVDLVDQLFVVFTRGQLEHLASVGQLFFERLGLLQLFGRGSAFAHQRLRLLLVVPKVGVAGQLIQLVDFSL